MNVADLLQEAPSDDHRRRQELRERDRERELRDHAHARNRDREREYDRNSERELDNQFKYAHRQQQPSPPYDLYPSDFTSHLPGPASFQSQFQVYDNNHRSRDPMSFGGPAPPVHGQPYAPESRPPGGPPHPPPPTNSSHMSPAFISPLPVSAPSPAPRTQHQQGDYDGDYNGPRDGLSRLQKHGTLGKPTQTVPLYPTPTGPMSERHRSVSLSRPRSPLYADYGGPPANSHSQLHPASSHPPSRSPVPISHFPRPPQHRDPQAQHFPPPLSHPAPSLHKSPLIHPQAGQQQQPSRRPPPPSAPPTPSHGTSHPLDSPAMGSLRPFEELGFSARGRSGSSAMNPNSLREREQRPREISKSGVEKDKEKDKVERDIAREKEQDRQRKVRAVAPNGNGHPSPSLSASVSRPSPSLAPGFARPDIGMQGSRGGVGPGQMPRRSSGESDREREREWERQRERERGRDMDQEREDMNAIRDAALTRIQSQGPGQGQGQGQSHHHHHPLPPPQRNLHPHPQSPHTHPHPNVQSNLHLQAHSRPPLGHMQTGHAPKPNKNTEVLTLAPPGVTVSNTVHNVKEEILPLGPANHPAPSSPAPLLQLGPGAPYQGQSLVKLGPKPFSAVPTGPGGPPQMFPQHYAHNNSHTQHNGQPPAPQHSHRHPLPPLPQPQQSFQSYLPTTSAISPDRLPSPPPSLLLPAIHLGTFVYPRTPFPYFFPSAAHNKERETRATILIPNAFLLRKLPHSSAMQIWGGGLGQGLYTYMGGVERGREGQRRVYTDDSNVLLCALHAGLITWGGVQCARKAGQDLRVELGLRREGRYLGGPAAVMLSGENVDIGLREKDGDGFTGPRNSGYGYGGGRDEGRDEFYFKSASWGNGHDGSGMEVLSAEWVHRRAAHSLGLRNRTQRILEYNERMLTIMKHTSDLSPVQTVLAKRRKRHEDAPIMAYSAGYDHERDDQMLAVERTIVFGSGATADRVGFKYHQTILKTLIFPSLPSSSSSSVGDRPRHKKRRKLGGTLNDGARAADIDMDSDSTAEGATSTLAEEPIPISLPQRDFILENDEERFLLLAITTGDEDKENHVDGGTFTGLDGERKGRRYHIFLVPPPSLERKVDSSETEGKPLFNRICEIERGMGDAATTAMKDSPQQALSPPSEERQPISDSDPQAQPTAEKLSLDRSENEVPLAIVEARMSSDALPSELSVLANSCDPLKPAHMPTKPPQLQPQPLYRDVGEESVNFQADGLAITGNADTGGKRTGWFIRVLRWKIVHLSRPS